MIVVERPTGQRDSYGAAESFAVDEIGCLVLFDEADEDLAVYPPSGWVRAWREVSQ